MDHGGTVAVVNIDLARRGSDLSRLYESLAAQFAPEVAGKCYVVRREAAPSMLGYTTTGRDFGVRQRLRAAGEWEGPRPVIAICGEFCADDEVAILSHELAHNLPFVPLDVEDIEPTPEQFDRQERMVAVYLTEQEPVNELLPPWLPHHGLSFVRYCLHLHHRAALAGFDLYFPSLSAAGWKYGLPPLIEFAQDLGDEPQRMINNSFAEINAAPVPLRYKQRWHDVAMNWVNANNQAKEAQNAEK